MNGAGVHSPQRGLIGTLSWEPHLGSVTVWTLQSEGTGRTETGWGRGHAGIGDDLLFFDYLGACCSSKQACA